MLSPWDFRPPSAHAPRPAAATPATLRSWRPACVRPPRSHIPRGLTYRVGSTLPPCSTAQPTVPRAHVLLPVPRVAHALPHASFAAAHSLSPAIPWNPAEESGT